MKTLWSFLVVSLLFGALAAGAFEPRAPDRDEKAGGDTSCVAALDKDYKDQKPQLETALKARDKNDKPLSEFWSGQCGAGRQPRDIVADLLPPRGPAGGGKPGAEPGEPALSRDSVKAVDASVARLTAADYHTLFDGGSATFADVRGPAAGGMGGPKPAPGAVAPQAPRVTPGAVRAMLADPALKDERTSSDLLQAEFHKAFEQTAHGRELLREWKADGVSGVPILVGPSPNAREGAAFHPDGNFYSINSDQLAKSYAWAKGKDEPAIAAFLATHPKERAEMVYDLQDTMLHEGWHSAQLAKYPLHGKYDVPEKDYIQLEYEAKMKGAGAYMERVEAERREGKKTLAGRDNTFVNDVRIEAVRLAYQGSDEFQRYIKQLYLTAGNGADLATGIQLQEDRIKAAGSAAEKAKLGAGLKQLEAAKAYFDKRVPAAAKVETSGAPVFLIHHAMDIAAAKPNDAMNGLYVGAENARARQPKWFESNRQAVIDSFNTAIDAEKKLLPKDCPAASPACDKRRSDLKEACGYIGRDPC